MGSHAIALEELSVAGPPKFSPLWESGSLAAISRALHGYQSRVQEGSKAHKISRDRGPAAKHSEAQPGKRSGVAVREGIGAPVSKRAKKTSLDNLVNHGKSVAEDGITRQDLHHHSQGSQTELERLQAPAAALPAVYNCLLLLAAGHVAPAASSAAEQSSVERKLLDLAKFSDTLLTEALAVKMV